MKKYFMVIAVVLPLLLLVLIRTFSGGHFRNNAERWVTSSVNQSNLISPAGMSALGGDLLIVRLSDSIPFAGLKGEMLTIPAASSLNRVNLKRFRQHKGNIVLVSDDPALSAKVYMLLCQMGHKNLLILTEDVQQESFKYKFRPEPLTWPEL